MSQKPVFHIYTDGACKGNPGVGGWGYLIKEGDATIAENHGGEVDATNNRMELMAVIQSLANIPRGAKVRLHSDSQYVLKGIKEWIHGWKRNGWKTADKNPVKNAELWRQLDALTANFEIAWVWVKGHNNNPNNERADTLANMGVASIQKTQTSLRRTLSPV